MNLTRRTLTIAAVALEGGTATLAGDRVPLRELEELLGRDVVVLTRAELDAMLADARRSMPPRVGRPDGTY